MSKGQALKAIVKLQEAGHHSASTRKNSMGQYKFPMATVTNHHKLSGLRQHIYYLTFPEV